MFIRISLLLIERFAIIFNNNLLFLFLIFITLKLTLLNIAVLKFVFNLLVNTNFLFLISLKLGKMNIVLIHFKYVKAIKVRKTNNKGYCSF